MDILESIGNTPLVEIRRLWDSAATGVQILAKLEGANPGGSVKDRPALFMIRKAVQSGDLSDGKIILEPTSGNTGIGMAMIAAAMGRRIVTTQVPPKKRIGHGFHGERHGFSLIREKFIRILPVVYHV